jgi:hypothetical protein
MRIHFPVLVLVAMSIEAALGAEMPAVIDRPRAQDGPTQVSVGIWIADITSIDSAQQTFTAEIAVVLCWKDPRLAHTGNGVVRYPIEQVWHPRVSIVNETNAVSRRHRGWLCMGDNGPSMITQRRLIWGPVGQPAVAGQPSSLSAKNVNSDPLWV